MLSKNRRISKTEFQTILSLGKRYNSSHILMYATPLSLGSSSGSRFAFSVSKKIAKTAVERNTLRRRGYSVVQKHLANISNGSYFFFTFKKGVEKLSLKEMEREILELLSGAGMLS